MRKLSRIIPTVELSIIGIGLISSVGYGILLFATTNAMVEAIAIVVAGFVLSVALIVNSPRIICEFAKESVHIPRGHAQAARHPIEKSSAHPHRKSGSKEVPS